MRRFFRQYGRLVLALAAVLALCAALPALFQQSRAIETGSWGLSFRTEGKAPVGNASAEALRRYDAVYLGNEAEQKIYLTFDAGYESGCTEPCSRELTSLEDLSREVTGEQMQKYYRPPQGIYSEKNLEMAQKLGYRTVFWSLAYVDWYQDDQPTDEQAFAKLLPRIHPGAVVLLHSTSQTNARILDTLLTKWEEMGYTFGTLDELYA